MVVWCHEQNKKWANWWHPVISFWFKWRNSALISSKITYECGSIRPEHLVFSLVNKLFRTKFRLLAFNIIFKNGGRLFEERKLKAPWIGTLMPCPSTGTKMFWAGPNFLSQTKNWIAFSSKRFCAGTITEFTEWNSCFGLAQNLGHAQYVNQF